MSPEHRTGFLFWKCDKDYKSYDRFQKGSFTRNWYFEMYARACNSSSNLRSDSHFFIVFVHPRSPLCSGTARRHVTEETRHRCSSVLTRDVLERHACYSGSGHDVSERHACSKG